LARARGQTCLHIGRKWLSYLPDSAMEVRVACSAASLGHRVQRAGRPAAAPALGVHAGHRAAARPPGLGSRRTARRRALRHRCQPPGGGGLGEVLRELAKVKDDISCIRGLVEATSAEVARLRLARDAPAPPAVKTVAGCAPPVPGLGIVVARSPFWMARVRQAMEYEGNTFQEQEDGTGAAMEYEGTTFREHEDGTGQAMEYEGSTFQEHEDGTGTAMEYEGITFREHEDDTGLAVEYEGNTLQLEGVPAQPSLLAPPPQLPPGFFPQEVERMVMVCGEIGERYYHVKLAGSNKDKKLAKRQAGHAMACGPEAYRDDVVAEYVEQYEMDSAETEEELRHRLQRALQVASWVLDRPELARHAGATAKVGGVSREARYALSAPR